MTSSPLNNLPTARLTPEEESRLSQRARAGDKKASHTLVLHNLREAVIYSRHCSNLFDEGELMSICYTVLSKSVKRYDPKFGIRFFAFTKNRIRGAVKRMCSKRDIVKHASANRTDESGQTFVPFTGGKDFESNDSVETCTQGGTVDFDFGSIHREEFWGRIQPAIRKLNPRQQMLLVLIYMVGFNMQEAGDLLGVSRSAVQATHATALEILHGELAEFRELFL